MALTIERKFRFEQPLEAGYFAYRPDLTITMEIESSKLSPLDLTADAKAKQLELAAEKKFGDDFTMKLGAELSKENLDKVADAIKSTSCHQFGVELKGLFETSLKGRFTSKFPLTWQLDTELSRTPIYIKLAGKWKNLDFSFGGGNHTVGTVIEGGCGFGLSKAGWITVAKKVGVPAVEKFLDQALPRLSSWLSPILGEALVGLAVAAAILGCDALGAYNIGKAHIKGELQGLATWYAAAYCKKLFHPSEKNLTIMVRPENADLVKGLVNCAWKDVVSDAKKNLKAKGLVIDTMSESEILKYYRLALVKAEGSADAAEAKMLPKMRDRAYELLKKRM